MGVDFEVVGGNEKEFFFPMVFLEKKKPLWLFLETPIKGLSLDFSSSAPTTVKVTTKNQDNRINWVIPKNLEKFDGNFDFSKTPKLATISSPPSPLTIVKTTITRQDNKINWVIPKFFGNLDGKSELLKIPKLATILPPPTQSTTVKIKKN